MDETAGSEGYGLLVELVQVFIVYSNILQLIYFGLLDSFDLVSLHINFLSDLSALFQEVQSILFLEVFVGRNLSSDLAGVIDLSLLSIFFDLSFLQLDLFLFLDLVHVVLSFDTSLLSQGRSFFRELLLSCLFEISLNSLPLGLLKLFSFSCLSLALFKGSLGSQGINFGLSVSCLLLKLTKSLDFSFLLFSNSLGFLLLLEFLLILMSLMLGYFVILVLFLLGTLLLLKESLSICLSGLLHQQVDLLSLGLMSGFIFFSHLFDICLKFNFLLISKFLFLHSKDSSFLDLIDDDLSSLLPSLSLANLPLLFLLKNLESLNFHHKVELFLLLNPFGLETLVLCKLLVTNSNDFRIKNHLIHLFNIIQFIIKHFLCL